MQWVPLISTDYWTVAIRDIKINGKSLGLCDDDAIGRGGGGRRVGRGGRGRGFCKAAVDTGSSFLLGPSDSVQEITEAIGLDPHCRNMKSLPDIVFVFDGERKNLRSSYYDVVSDDKSIVGDGDSEVVELPITPENYVVAEEGYGDLMVHKNYKRQKRMRKTHTNIHYY